MRRCSWRATSPPGARRKLRVLVIPARGRPTVTYEIAVVSKSQQLGAATAYVAKIRSAAGKAILRRHGFSTP